MEAWKEKSTCKNKSQGCSGENKGERQGIGICDCWIASCQDRTAKEGEEEGKAKRGDNRGKGGRAQGRGGAGKEGSIAAWDSQGNSAWYEDKATKAKAEGQADDYWKNEQKVI